MRKLLTYFRLMAKGVRLIKAKNKTIKDQKHSIKTLRKENKRMIKKTDLAVGKAFKEKMFWRNLSDELIQLRSEANARVAAQKILNLEIMQKAGLSEKHNHAIATVIHNMDKSVEEGEKIYN